VGQTNSIDEWVCERPSALTKTFKSYQLLCKRRPRLKRCI